jgi:hypothetical protein
MSPFPFWTGGQSAFVSFDADRVSLVIGPPQATSKAAVALNRVCLSIKSLSSFSERFDIDRSFFGDMRQMTYARRFAAA